MNVAQTSTAPRKRVRIPVEGDYLSDGKRLVEVVKRCPEGWRVRDVVKSLKGRTELIENAKLLRWSIVEPEED